MTDPVNIGPPRDTMAAEDCEFALRLYLMNQPNWPRNRHGGEPPAIVWPTLKSYLWMKNLENNNEGSRNRSPSLTE